MSVDDMRHVAAPLLHDWHLSWANTSPLPSFSATAPALRHIPRVCLNIDTWTFVVNLALYLLRRHSLEYFTTASSHSANSSLPLAEHSRLFPEKMIATEEPIICKLDRLDNIVSVQSLGCVCLGSSQVFCSFRRARLFFRVNLSFWVCLGHEKIWAPGKIFEFV